MAVWFNGRTSGFGPEDIGSIPMAASYAEILINQKLNEHYNGITIPNDKTRREYNGNRHNLKIWLYEIQNGICTVCDKKMLPVGTEGPKSPTLDHFIPLAQFGTDTIDNIKMIHKKCNDKKGHRLPPLLDIIAHVIGDQELIYAGF